eukprot:scaffold2119_cov264-Pinguiococcus_pyrenoidosus.AAC.11
MDDLRIFINGGQGLGQDPAHEMKSSVGVSSSKSGWSQTCFSPTALDSHTEASPTPVLFLHLGRIHDESVLQVHQICCRVRIKVDGCRSLRLLAANLAPRA